MSDQPPYFENFTTADGSPTLILCRDDGYAEKMHHSRGALAESLYIYHHALVCALDLGLLPKVISFGLGLGYNELITMAEVGRRGLLPRLTLWSFESEPFLRDEFRAWLNGAPPTPLTQVLNLVGQMVAQAFAIELQQLKQWALLAHKQNKFYIKESFPDTARDVNGATVIYYDAFSKKMNQGPWIEEQIINDLEPRLAAQAVLATYAATGSLNRALKRMGFRLLDRPGFQGKRESTLAIRA